MTVMFPRAVFALAVSLLAFSSASAEDRDSRVYELRVYYAHPGKLADLEERFRKHTTKLFEDHGMTNVGYWVPIDNKDNQLIYLLSFPSQKARADSWKSFSADPAWKKVKEQTEANGPLVKKVDSVLLAATDYSPAVKPSKTGGRVFELRTYTTTPGNLDNLNARFRDHTLKLFEKHGMTNVAYWTPIKGTRGVDDTLIYILAHKSVDAARESFDSFRKDPDWDKARKASEEKAGGPLTVKDGVKSTFMKPTDYSPLK